VKISAVVLAGLAIFGAATAARAQDHFVTQGNAVVQDNVVVQQNQTPSYRINVVSRTTPAMNYGHRDSTKIDFRGTDLMPSISGEARVQSKRGDTKISAEFEGLQEPTTFGGEYLTYVLWAISPEGRPANLGEVLVGDDHRSKLEATSEMQAFALIVTAEPYYAVRRPSNVVVAENAIRRDTVGPSEDVNAKYELIDRGGYIPTGFHFDPIVLKAGLPLEFYEARNALQIAKSAGAETYAASSYENAVNRMKEADDLAMMRHVDKKALIATSREAVQTADDAREIAVKRMDADRASADKHAAAAQLADATAQSAADAQARANAEAATADADRQSAKAKQDAADALAKQQAAQADAERNLTAASDAIRATADAQQAQRNAEADSERNKAAAASSDAQLQQAIQDREQLRARLLIQFNAILSTRDTARGLVVNLSDVLFDTGKYTLRPMAREKLAKISGIVLAYPDLRLAIEGNTDSVGSDAMNQDLSERRANAVMDFLAQQSIPAGSMTSQGFGKTQPVASNDTAEGRQQNRRVEMVVSGDVIGTAIGPVSEALPLNSRP
jgi:outer membrane protein OmpA-like peptidoglycan-associated protein